jgi:hypothetical protein
METKVLILKSGEKIICGFEERDGDKENYYIEFPRVIASAKIDEKTKSLQIAYEAWCNSIVEDNIKISSDWVAVIAEAHIDVKHNYEQCIMEYIKGLS